MDEKLRKRTILRRELESAYLKETRSYKVYLPPNYDSNQAYPVLYAQDGEQFLNFGRGATIAQEMILKNKLLPFIIVAVTVSRENRTEEYGTGRSRNHIYKSFFLEEIIPAVEQEFLVSERVLVGDSLGGTVSLDLALDRPDLFNKVLSLSGAFYPEVMKGVLRKPKLPHLTIYMLVGLQETAVPVGDKTADFLSYNREMKQLLEQRQAFVTYTEKEGGHDWGFWQNQLPDALSFFFGVK
ncbi:alpha/beta hydrolase [Aneurinibacillus aneurinilyticus]|uniref:Putative esterase n=1 Tax=Aneurinibacillus aneurinilyticus ATCC 12856 TaxID=649747 RepID=U1WZ01_ANEAE|nr:alpha/beta hydrolase-fold protein [Aneurinibacillus aneurinilyticus]ERI07925.1 putative esterase [Aneurinibacillus aneurinilyticus ATCC 12856]MED0670142.1 alpha/beta hydrolase-fold protein [Aneurinibacillus aneurinilyticus]MED0705433.1 alpha/beta hydrolase-fold protein [Aneurinibacillus aneurinilyticus]MED0724948.1 alpha/beta hydrolase-fold protein [Aneurinibacillus aneurinilyticus]MED0731030.1 alpha/beta hydrolase-fold protein [Aneurinibacillus aneurinilyticus]